MNASRRMRLKQQLRDHKERWRDVIEQRAFAAKQAQLVDSPQHSVPREIVEAGERWLNDLGARILRPGDTLVISVDDSVRVERYRGYRVLP